jgi:hypothetical protein
MAREWGEPTRPRRGLMALLRRRPGRKAARLARRLDELTARSIAEREELSEALARATETGRRWKAIADELLPGNVRRGPWGA